MKEIARRPDYIMDAKPYNDDEINDRNRVNLINLALQELGEMDFIYDPNDTSYKDPEYTLFYNRLNRLKDARKLALDLDKIKKRKIIERRKLERDRLRKEAFDREYEDYRNRTEDYVPFEPEGVSYDEEGNVAFEPEKEEEEEEELPNEDILDSNIAMREQGLKDLFDEEKDLFQGIKLMSDLLKKINEPFARVWAKLTNSMVLIDEDMKDILNAFNEFRQQTLNNPRTADEEKEDLLNNPYGRTMKGGNFTKRGYWEEKRGGGWGEAEGYYPDNTKMSREDYNKRFHYAMPPMLTHPSGREMARYYGSGGSKYL